MYSWVYLTAEKSSHAPSAAPSGGAGDLHGQGQLVGVCLWDVIFWMLKVPFVSKKIISFPYPCSAGTNGIEILLAKLDFRFRFNLHFFYEHQLYTQVLMEFLCIWCVYV